MKRIFPLLIGVMLLASCVSLPPIRPVIDRKTACPSPFPLQITRLIHAIEVRAAGGTQTVMIGVTLIDPFLQTCSCAILTPEGMALFEAAQGPSGIAVSRALPPFDADDFARNMMDDIGLIFLAPPGKPVERGIGAGGEPVCRWQKDRGNWVDISQNADGRIGIRRYSEDGGLKRNVMLSGRKDAPYAAIELQAKEMVDYTLIMTLIESETVQNEPVMKGKSP